MSDRSSPVPETFKEELMRRLREADPTVNVFIEQIEERDVVIFLGSTKGGKSTLMNYLIGTELEAFDSGLLGLKIRKSGDSAGPAIGRGSLSQTSVPEAYVMQDDAVIIDAPGFDDNRGPVQNIINGFYINQINKARSVKFVMVSDISEIASDNINIFLSALNHMIELLNRLVNRSPLVSVVFTKAPRRWDQAGIANLLNSQILSNDFRICNSIIRNIVNNLDLIGIFKLPERECLIGNELDVNIHGAIDGSQAIDGNTFSFTLSDEAKGCLLEVYPEYTDTNYFNSEVSRIVRSYQNFLEQDWVFASYDEELSEAKRSLEALNSLVREHRHSRPTQLDEIQSSLETLIGSSVTNEFATSFEFVVKLDKAKIIDDEYKGQIERNYRASLIQLLKKINAILNNIEEETNTRVEDHIKFSSNQNLKDVLLGVVVGVSLKIGRFSRDQIVSLVNAIKSAIDDIDESTLRKVFGSAFLVVPAAMEAAEVEVAGESLLSIVSEVLTQAVKLAPRCLPALGILTGGLCTGAAVVVYNDVYVKRLNVRKNQKRYINSFIHGRRQMNF